MKTAFDSHKQIRPGEVSPKLSKKGPHVVLEGYSVEDAEKSPSVQGELIANCDKLDFRSRIYTVRGVQVMLDRDLALAYHVSTTVFNQAVKRNLSRFPEGFRFQLTKDEHSVLMSQIVISKRELGQETRGGYHKLPYAFTEQGIAMLSGILRSDVAIAVSIRLMNTFVEMRRALASMVPVQARLDAIERRQISDQSRNEERFDQIFAKMSEGEMPSHQIFYQGRFWDAKSLLIKFIRRAKKSLVVVDAYLGVATLDMLAKRQRGVSIELITHSNGDLAETDFEAFGRQYGNLTKSICGICHDRFIIADNTEVYWVGASLKDAGRLTFAVAKIGADIIPGLIDSLRKATSDQKEYGRKPQKAKAHA